MPASDGVTNFKIDVPNTFAHLMIMQGGPKIAYGDATRQETTKDGVPKWELEIVAGVKQFDKVTSKVIKVGVVSSDDPTYNLAVPGFVVLDDLEIGVMERTDRDGKVIGFQVWYRASAVRALESTTGPARRRSGAEDAA